jgi:hypothetical protein
MQGCEHITHQRRSYRERRVRIEGSGLPVFHDNCDWSRFLVIYIERIPKFKFLRPRHPRIPEDDFNMGSRNPRIEVHGSVFREFQYNGFDPDIRSVGHNHRIFSEIGLSLDLPQSNNGGNRSSNPDRRQYPRSQRGPERVPQSLFGCIDRPALNFAGPCCFFLCVGCFFWRLYVTFCIYDERPRRGAYLIGYGLICSFSGALLACLWATYPLTWGLPPQWLPEKRRTCQQSDGNQQFPHKETVSQNACSQAYYRITPSTWCVLQDATP